MLASVPVISEFMAVNDSTIEDVDGDDSDWIELHNAGDDSMSLDRWYLTDDQNDLRKWRFPAVELGGGDYLVVFASGKDRDVPGAELHTNFRLTGSGEYLALVQPDGVTIAHEYATAYPQQVPNVSYGIPTGISTSELISAGAAAKYLIPTDGSLDVTEPDVVSGTWLDPELDDSAWSDATTGIGFVPSTEPQVLANSEAEFSGVQGQDNWFYGSWLGNFDADGVYSMSDFGEIGTNFFNANENLWSLGRAGTGALITPTGGSPFAAGPSFSQSVIRRWVSETDGELTIEGTFANNDATGDGVVGLILVNDETVYERTLNGESTDYSLNVNVRVGDFIDFVLLPGDADDTAGDASTFTAQISGVPLQLETLVQVADSTDDWSRDGVQGENGWVYGYYAPHDDADSAYQASDFIAFGASEWNGRRWEPSADLETEISSSNMYPHADENVVQWPIRRWEATVDGSLSVEWRVSKSTSSGDGATARLYHNGVEIDVIQIPTTSGEFTKTVRIEGVAVGDAIDLAMDPVGSGDPQQPDDDGDRLRGWMTISRIPKLEDSISTSIRDEMLGTSSSLYVRIPFQVDSISDLDVITLNMRYDDGFLAYVNGHLVASANHPDATAYNSQALAERPVEEATLPDSFDLTSERRFFAEGTNVLQIHALNANVGDEDLLIEPQLLIGTASAELDQSRYFELPTPLGENGLGADKLGPLVVDVQHSPAMPQANEPLVITADISRTFNDVANVELTYRVMYDDSVTITMVDDGTGQDQTAGDGTYTAMIPGNIATDGQMIRWFVTAKDTSNLSGRFPVFADANNHEEYEGTMVATEVDTKMEVLHWFVERRSRAMGGGGARGSLFYNGEFYDNVEFSLHGQSSSGFSTQKKSMNVDMPNDHRFLLSDDIRRLEDFNLLTNFADKSKMRNTLGYAQRAATGGGYHIAFPIRVQHNGEFFGIYDFVEDGDQRWLDRLGLDENGSLYKIYNTFNSVASAEKKTREDEGNDDLRDVIAGITQRGDDDTTFIFDNINLAQMANYLAGFVLTSNVDCCHKNYYAYHDVEGTGEWWYLPWDVDLSNGRNWGGFGLAYFDDTIYHQRGLSIGSNNTLIGKLYNEREVPGFREMYWRRVRTLIDEYVKPPGTPREELPLETHVDQLYELMKPDADLDNELHPARWGQTGFQTFDEAVQILLTEYATPRRRWLYETQVQADATDLPVLLSGEPGATMAAYFVPKDDSLGLSWTQPDFDDGAWKTGPMGLGFENDPDDFTELIKTNIQSDIQGSTSVYARIRFNVDDPAALDALSLRMMYDDGYVAYLNGVEVARQRLRQDEPAFDSTAQARANRLATEFENVNISDFISALRPGENVLAIQGINSTAAGNDLLILPELVEGVLGSGSGPIPPAQVGNPKIDFATIEFNPNSGNQREEYIELVNNHEVAVDISGWRLEGAIDKTFDPGTVIPAGWTLYAVADAKAFRARSEGPSGGMQLFVQGNYDGELPNSGGEFQLVARDGEVVNTATYQGEISTIRDDLRVTEVMYHPLGASAAELAVDNTLVDDDFEYIELVNISDAETISLQNVRFTEGVTFDFSNSQVTELAPGQRTLVVRNTSAFEIRYGTGLSSMIAGEFTSNTALRDSGERLKLIDGSGLAVAEFQYSDRGDQGWPERADGGGSSLQIIDPLGEYASADNWRASSEINGSPGRAGDAPINGLVINELISRTADPEVDRVELFNPTGAPINLAGYYLSDSANSVDTLRHFAFGDGMVAAGGYFVVDESNFNAGGGQNANDFALNGDRGDSLFLTIGDANGPTHFVDHVSFGAASTGESFGRTPNGSGRLAPMQTPTFGATNSDPRVGPVVMTEINYNPGLPTAAAIAIYDALTPDDLEFIEIHNASPTAVDLTNMRIRGGIDLNFDDGTQLAAGQTAVVISFNPDNDAARTNAFRAHYGISESVVLLGGYAGQLSDQGEGLRVLRPGDPPADDPTFIPRLLEDEVIYDDAAPWPTDANGSKSLTRVAPTAYGNDPTAWTAADPTPGTIGDLLGDVTGDGVVNVHDVDAVCSARMTGDVSFDLNGDGAINEADTLTLINDILGTSIGDVDLDGVFDSHDIVLIFRAGQYQDGEIGNSTWATGDWNCDGEFASDDLALAMQAGGYVAFGQPLANNNAAVAAALSHDASQPTSKHVAETEDKPVDNVISKHALLELLRHDAVFADTQFDRETVKADDVADDLAVSLEHERHSWNAFDI